MSPDFGNPARAAWREAVAEIAEKAKQTLPECNGRVESAVKIVLAGDVELLEGGKAKVASQSNGTTAYFVVNGACECKDFPRAPSGWCKHRIAAGMQKRAHALAKAKLNGTPPDDEAPAAEAPVQPAATPEALPAPRVIPQSPLGVSVWTLGLLDTDLYGRPTHRFCEALRHHGLHLSQGTLTDGLQRIAVLFEPVMPALSERQMSEKLFHGDETRWEVCEEVEGKTGHRWSLWVMQSSSVVFYIMAPGRGADVPTAHVAGLRKDLVDVVLVCDRSRAYKCLARGNDELLLA
jgi:hypothetical protein